MVLPVKFVIDAIEYTGDLHIVQINWREAKHCESKQTDEYRKNHEAERGHALLPRCRAAVESQQMKETRLCAASRQPGIDHDSGPIFNDLTTAPAD
jgi:hypothetical protein